MSKTSPCSNTVTTTVVFASSGPKEACAVPEEIRHACERFTLRRTGCDEPEIDGADFSFATICSEASVRCIVQALHSEAAAAKITKLTMEGCSFDTVQSLATILEAIGSGACPRLVSLNLSSLKLLDGQSPHNAFAKLIRSAPLAHVDLSNNCLDVKALGSIAQAMTEGPRTLLQLDLGNKKEYCGTAPEQHQALLRFIDSLLKSRTVSPVGRSEAPPPPSSPTSVVMDSDAIRPATTPTSKEAKLFGSPPPPFDCSPVEEHSAKKDERRRQRRRMWQQMNANEKSTLTLSSRYVVDESIAPPTPRQSVATRRCGDSMVAPRQEVLSRLPSIC